MSARLLLDTNAVIWALEDDARLSRAARTAIAGPGAQTFFSAASLWEISTKVRIGKLRLVRTPVAAVEATLVGAQYTPLPILPHQGLAAGLLPGDHRDPFDRMIAAQALDLGATVVSTDPVFDEWGIARIG